MYGRFFSEEVLREDAIRKTILCFIRDRIKKSIGVAEANPELCLFSHRMRLSYIDMAYLCHMLEKTYGIEFLPEDYDMDQVYSLGDWFKTTGFQPVNPFRTCRQFHCHLIYCVHMEGADGRVQTWEPYSL
jgi:hypothetical protein